MKVVVKRWHAVAQWRWDTGTEEDERQHAAGNFNNNNGGDDDDDEDEGNVCGICRVAYEGCCPTCKMPGDDCPLVWGECTHVFHMHCILQWINTPSSNRQCPMDRRPWNTAERTTTTMTSGVVNEATETEA